MVRQIQGFKNGSVVGMQKAGEKEAGTLHVE